MIYGGILLVVISIVMLIGLIVYVRKQKSQDKQAEREMLQKLINFNYLIILIAVIGFGLLTIGLIFR